MTLSLPIAFLQKEDAWQCVAVLGLVPGQNLFVGPDGRWLGGYVPGNLRAYPFAMGRSANKNEQLLCVNEGSGLVVEDGGNSFFAGEGELSEPVKKIWSLLLHTAQGEAVLAKGSALLANAGVVEPWPITLKDGDKTRTVEGLHRISEKELNGLDDEAFTRLRRAGVLTLAYAQMFSTAHLPKVGELANAHANHSAAKKRQADEAKTRSNSIGISDSLDIDWSKIGR